MNFPFFVLPYTATPGLWYFFVFKFTQTKPFEVASAMSAAEGAGAAGVFTLGAFVAVPVAVACGCAPSGTIPRESSEAVATAAVINFVVKRFMTNSLLRRPAKGNMVLDYSKIAPNLVQLAFVQQLRII